MTADSGYLWATSRNPSQITKFDISTQQIVGQYPRTTANHVLPNGVQETSVIHGGGYIWALSGTGVARYTQ